MNRPEQDRVHELATHVLAARSTELVRRSRQNLVREHLPPNARRELDRIRKPDTDPTEAA